MKFACAILLLLTVGNVSATKPAQAAAPPLVLDGIGTSFKFSCLHFVTVFEWCDEVAQSQLLTTSKGNDVVMLIVECGDGNRPCTNTPTIIDGSGLSFTQRLSYSFNGGKIWEYYAIATSPLRSDNITVAYSCSESGNPLASCGGDSLPILALAIHGANTRAIFDQSSSIPSTCSLLACGNCEVGFGTCSVSIETSTLDFIIAITAINDAPSCGGFPVVVPGFVNIATDDQLFEVDYAITTTSQSNVTFNCNGTDAIAIVVDAISFRGAFGI